MVVLGIVIFMFLLLGQFFGGMLIDYDNFYNIILIGYNKDGRLVLDQGIVINVMIFFILIIIVNLDEVMSEMIIVGSFIIVWKDEKFCWILFLYGNILMLIIDEFVVWKFLMIFFNFMLINVGFFGMKQFRIKYFEDGFVYWMIVDWY